MKDKCKNCGADNGLHQWGTNQCPAGGMDQSGNTPEVWEYTTYLEDDGLLERIEALEAQVERLDALVSRLFSNQGA